MPTRRKPLRRGHGGGGITPQAVSVFSYAVGLLKASAEETGPIADDALAAELREMRNALHLLLGRRPWQEDVLNTLGCDDAIPRCLTREDHVADWVRARELRRALEAEAG